MGMIATLLSLLALSSVVSCNDWLDDRFNKVWKKRASCEMTRPNVSSSDQQRFVDFHNKYRAMEDGSGIFAMSWSDELAQRAQAWADVIVRQDALSHGYVKLCNGDSIGQNIWSFKTTSLPSMKHVSESVPSWYSEKPFYTFSTRRCKAGEMCGHYTQVVWDSSRLVGCGASLAKVGSWWKTIVVCDYLPPGNYVGKDPYKKGPKGTTCTSTALPAPPAGTGWTVRSDGLCDYCKGGSAKCNCFSCGSFGTSDPKTCTCKCQDGYTGSLCNVNCKDRKSASTCRGWLYHCPEASYKKFMQDNCPCACANAGHSGYNCCK